jgi:hypothetical protein
MTPPSMNISALTQGFPQPSIDQPPRMTTLPTSLWLSVMPAGHPTATGHSSILMQAA